jgi:threonine synthase
MHGATLELVPGPRQATADEAIRQSQDSFYASSGSGRPTTS